VPIGPTNQNVTIEWYRDAGETHTRKERFDSADYNVFWEPYPKKQEFVKPATQEVVYATASVLLTDRPKHPLAYDTTMIVANGIRYEVANLGVTDMFGLYAASISLVEHRQETL
jgi:hypothetical protein